MSLSAKSLIQRKSKAEGRTFLKYADLPFGTRQLKVLAKDVRETPRLNNPLCIDIGPEVEVDGRSYRHEATSISLNLTNLQALAKLVGEDDLTIARGMVFTFSFSIKKNPNALPGAVDAEVMGYDLIAVDLPDAPQAPPADPPAAAPEKPKGRR